MSIIIQTATFNLYDNNSVATWRTVQEGKKKDVKSWVPPNFTEINWQITSCMFKVYNVVIWCMYILWNEYCIKVS